MSYMAYILFMIPFVPVVGGATALIYILLNKITKQNIRSKSRKQIFTEFIFTGWCMAFLFVTQLMDFGSGLGGRGINLTPMQPFVTAFRYGSENSAMVTQIALNITMFVPLGFLLPIIWPKRFNRFLPILGISFGLTAATELVQMSTARSSDIDDIIANTLGGVLGFAIYVLGRNLAAAVRKNRREITVNAVPKKHGIQTIISCLLIAVTIAPFITVKIVDGQTTYGHVYYGHMSPANPVINCDAGTEESQRPVYRYAETEKPADLMKRLKETSGITGEETKGMFDVALMLENADMGSIFIYDNNRWMVSYDLAADEETDTALLPKKEDAVKMALEYLRTFGITDVEFVQFDEDYADDNLHLSFQGTDAGENELLWGEVYVTIGENGSLLSIHDNRVRGKLAEMTDTISQEQSLRIFTEVGVSEWEYDAEVTGIEESYYFNPDTGYIIPTWKVHCTYSSAEGGSHTDTAEINGVR